MTRTLRQALRYPLQSSVLLAIIAYVLLNAFARQAGLFGIALYWFVNVGALGYSYVVFRSAAHGHRTVRAVHTDDLNLFGSRSLLAIALLLLVPAAMSKNAHAFLSVAQALAVDVALGIVMPASLCLMTLNESLRDALNPVKIVQTIALLGPIYLWMPGALLIAGVISNVVATIDPPFLLDDLVMAYVAMTVISLWGLTLHRYRDRVGLDAANDDSLRESLIQRQDDKDRKAAMDVAFAESRTDHKRALAVIEEWLTGENETLEMREWAFEYARDWPNEMVPLRLAQQLINRHLTLGNDARALELTVYGLGRADAFRPAGANATLKVATVANRSGRPRVVTAVLRDFGARFTDHSQRGPAALLCATLALEKTNELALAREQLLIVEATAALRSDPRVARLRATLETT